MVVHHLEQARIALKVAAARGVEIQLRSAPHAAAGVGYLHALGEALGHDLLIDCLDDPALVMAALRAGCRKVAYDGPADSLRRLDSMAARYEAILVDRTDPDTPSLILTPEDGEAAVRAWLDARA